MTEQQRIDAIKELAKPLSLEGRGRAARELLGWQPGVSTKAGLGYSPVPERIDLTSVPRWKPYVEIDPNDFE